MTASDAAGEGGVRGVAERLGIKAGDLVQQFGYGEDADDAAVADIESVVGELVAEDSDDVVDFVLLWFRDGDGDLVDTLVDVRRGLSDDGAIWLLAPKAGRDGHVEPADVLESVPTAGLAQTSTVSVGQDWTAMRLAAPKGTRAPRR
ncbi:MAG: DUF3052 domain-containing protein [Mycobacteriales bacterium]